MKYLFKIYRFALVALLPLTLFTNASFSADWDDFAWDESYAEEDSYDSGEGGGNSATVGILDILDENRSLQLKPEEFIYPFSAEHKPMLASNLVDSVQGIAQVFESKRVVSAKAKRKKGRALSAKNVGKRVGIPVKEGISLQGLPIGPRGAVQVEDGKIPRVGQTKASKGKTRVVLPPFEISGTFSRNIGSDIEQYIVVGNRYYTIEDKLKGSRNLRKVRLIGIDEQFAYFTYQDVSFVKKIKALESVF